MSGSLRRSRHVLIFKFGLYFRENLLMWTFMQKNLVKSIYFNIKKISNIRKFITIDAAKKLAVYFVISRIDYCNSLLVGLPDEKMSKLQRAQNCAARLTLGKKKYESSKTMLSTLHWLPVKARIEYKLASICYKSFESNNPSCIK